MDNLIPVKRKRFIYRKVTVNVTEALKSIDCPEFNLDKNTESVEGVCLTTDNEDAIPFLLQRLEISGNEILPKDFEARLLYAYASVPVNDRFYEIREPSGNQNIKISCMDTSITGFVPYKATYTFKCVLKD